MIELSQYNIRVKCYGMVVFSKILGTKTYITENNRLSENIMQAKIFDPQTAASYVDLLRRKYVPELWDAEQVTTQWAF